MLKGPAVNQIGWYVYQIGHWNASHPKNTWQAFSILRNIVSYSKSIFNHLSTQHFLPYTDSHDLKAIFIVRIARLILTLLQLAS